MPAVVEQHPLAKLSDAQRNSLADLLVKIWPSPGKDRAFRLEQIRQRAARPVGPAGQAPTAFLIRQEERVIASAVTWAQPVTISGEPFLALALLQVAVDPEFRGQGLGEEVVRAAFEQVESAGFDFSLFQTTFKVQPFYERLGAAVVANQVIDSTAADPNKNPFWDEVVMRYPATRAWRAGVIDLCGPGY